MTSDLAVRMPRFSLRMWLRRKWNGLFPKPGNLELHARRELETAGLFGKDSDYGGMMGEAVMKMIKQFSREGHSGFSAGMAISIFQKVARFELLTPLRGTDDEWIDHGGGHFQNNRCSHVFKQPDRFSGQAYDSEGIIWRDPDGSTFTNSESRVPITFPYMPKTEVRARAASG